VALSSARAILAGAGLAAATAASVQLCRLGLLFGQERQRYHVILLNARKWAKRPLAPVPWYGIKRKIIEADNRPARTAAYRISLSPRNLKEDHDRRAMLFQERLTPSSWRSP
jgi:hypothetical protein